LSSFSFHVVAVVAEFVIVAVRVRVAIALGLELMFGVEVGVGVGVAGFVACIWPLSHCVFHSSPTSATIHNVISIFISPTPLFLDLRYYLILLNYLLYVAYSRSIKLRS
jgi:hypothetical protein